MKKYISNIALIVLLCASQAAVASMPYYNSRLRNTNYINFMKQYAGREYQIITPDNLINMDWLRGAVAAVFNDGYTYDSDIAQALWMHIANVVNFAAQRYPNQDEFKTRMWQALTRSIDQLRQQGNQQQYPSSRSSSATSYPAAPTVASAPRALPKAPTVTTAPTRTYTQAPTVASLQGRSYTPSEQSLTIADILGGALGAEHASKLRQIFEYNDERSKREGMIALASAITTDITNINEDNIPHATRVVDLKRRIDAIYTKMLQRRAYD